jgi:hypothetical protein
MGGFADWVENIADSRDGKDYRQRVKDSESVSMWQSLGFGPNYKAAYCMAVCPAGEDVIGPYLASKKDFTDDVVRPLQAKREPVYVVRGSDAADARAEALSAQDRATGAQFAASAQHRQPAVWNAAFVSTSGRWQTGRHLSFRFHRQRVG